MANQLGTPAMDCVAPDAWTFQGGVLGLTFKVKKVEIKIL
jgi:hypothetical protein